METIKNLEKRKKATALDSVILMVIVIAWLVLCVKNSIGLAAPMFFTWAIIFGFCKLRNIDFELTQQAIFDSIRSALGAIIILIAVGALIGTWIGAGTIPAIIYVGLKLISPKVFLLCTLIICSLIALATGTSYGSAGSAGIAMMAIGMAMGIPVGMVAGAVICGALFGDKLSPFSDTTNLSPAMAGGDLFTHIKSMMYTTLPTYLVSAAAFTFLGFRYGANNYDINTIEEYCNGISSNFHLSLWTMLPVVLVIVLLVLKVDAIPALALGGISGFVCSMVIQGKNFAEAVGFAYNGYSIESGILLVDKLLNRGGINSMTSTVYVMLFAVGLGGALEHLGVLEHLLAPVVNKINSNPKLIGATLIVSYASGMIGCTMAMAHVLTGKIMSPVYKEKNVAPEVLSRTMEDAGTCGAALIPWHTTAIYFTGVLGVTYIQYIPYAFICYLAPFMAMICAFTGFGMLDKGKKEFSKTKAVIE